MARMFPLRLPGSNLTSRGLSVPEAICLKCLCKKYIPKSRYGEKGKEQRLTLRY